MTAAQVMASGLGKRFAGTEALAGIDLALQQGVVAVLGPNGSGKTTLLRCLATISRPDAGTLLVDGLDPLHESDRIEVRRRLGYLPQEVRLARSARVFDLLEYVAVLKGHRDDRARRHLTYGVLARVGLADRATDRVAELSGGMRRRLGVAQAILGSPTLLVLDEPAAGLDPDERFRLRDIVSERRQEATVIVSTHLTDEAAIADTILVLADGRLRYVGTPERLAQMAAGHVWLQLAQPTQADQVRASWRQADGQFRCLGNPPPAAQPVTPQLEDGYLLLLG